MDQTLFLKKGSSYARLAHAEDKGVTINAAVHECSQLHPPLESVLLKVAISSIIAIAKSMHFQADELHML